MNSIPNYDGSRPEPPYTTECEECDRLRSDLDAIAKERSGPHCLRCRNAAACSTRDDDRAVPLCVTDPEGSMPLWDPVTLADVHAVASELDAARAELARVRRQLLRRMGDAAVEKAKSLEVALNKERERRGRKWPSDVIRAFRRLNRMHGAVEAILRAEELARMEAP